MPQNFKVNQVRYVLLNIDLRQKISSHLFNIILQFYGKVYMSWTDASLCETGFTFERSGNHFTPVYQVQAQQTCGVSHSPTTVYDDLETAEMSGQAVVGTKQTYCIYAVNPIGCTSGSYTSAANCVDVLINWEAAINGIITSTVAMGSSPIAGVTVTWFFVDAPEISGTGITNSDGRFVEAGTNALGIDIQVQIICDLHLIRTNATSAFAL